MSHTALSLQRHFLSQIPNIDKLIHTAINFAIHGTDHTSNSHSPKLTSLHHPHLTRRRSTILSNPLRTNDGRIRSLSLLIVTIIVQIAGILITDPVDADTRSTGRRRRRTTQVDASSEAGCEGISVGVSAPCGAVVDAVAVLDLGLHGGTVLEAVFVIGRGGVVLRTAGWGCEDPELVHCWRSRWRGGIGSCIC